jgi:hypothetical protein
MATKAECVNWQSLYEGSMAALRPTPGNARSPRQMPIFQLKDAKANEIQARERAFSNAASALAALWKLR